MLVGLEQGFKMRLRQSRRQLGEGPVAVQGDEPPDQVQSEAVSGEGMWGQDG